MTPILPNKFVERCTGRAPSLTTPRQRHGTALNERTLSATLITCSTRAITSSACSTHTHKRRVREQHCRHTWCSRPTTRTSATFCRDGDALERPSKPPPRVWRPRGT
jgi:hypothetical protein